MLVVGHVSGTGAWESALTNTLSPGDKIISFRLGQFSLLWIDQMQRLNFDVDVVECEWGAGADLDILKQKLESDYSKSVKAVCVVHNETSTGVTNNIGTVRKILGKFPIPSPVFLNFRSSEGPATQTQLELKLKLASLVGQGRRIWTQICA